MKSENLKLPKERAADLQATKVPKPNLLRLEQL